MNIADIFGQPQQQNGNWNIEFDKLINKLIKSIRDKGILCDKTGQQNIPNGKTVRITLSKDQIYKEHYEVFYVDLDIGYNLIQ